MTVEGIRQCLSYWVHTGLPEMLAIDRPPSCVGDGVRRCLLVEFNRMHGEVLAGLNGFFSNMGYSVDVLVRPSLLTERFGDPFALFGRPPRTYRLTMKRMLRYITSPMVRRYAFVFVGTEYIYDKYGGVCGMVDEVVPPAKRKVPFFTIRHGIDYPPPYRGTNPTFRFSMSEWSGLAGMPTASISITRCGDDAIQRPETRVRTTFVTVGQFNDKLRNISMVKESVRRLIECGAEFEILVIGKIPDSVERVWSGLPVRFLGGLSYENMFRAVANADFFLPLLDEAVPSNRIYLAGTTSGAKQLILGCNVIPVIQRPFCKAYGFSESNAIIYDGDNLTAAMLSAMKMTYERREAMRKSLMELRCRLEETARRNFVDALASANQNRD